jgi:hypothetical protein
MMQPVLVIFATRYDPVTFRTHCIARRLLVSAEQLGIATLALFETAATGAGLLEAAASRPTVLALYSHGDAGGAILAQNQQPCWTEEAIPDLSAIVLFAHACRGIRWLEAQACHHKARLLVGYEGDLISPANGSDEFWAIYEEIHSFVPRNLAAGVDRARVRLEFYGLCTKHLHELDVGRAPLIELVALLQSRDELRFVEP